MPASQEYTDNVVELKVLRELVGTDWIKESVLYKSGAVAYTGKPLPTGTFSVAVRNQMFEDDEDGQAIGIGSSLSKKDRKQVEISHPIVRRGNVGLLDEVQGEIQAGGPEDVASMANEIRIAAATYMDTALLRAVEGIGAAITTNQSGNGATIDLPGMNTAKYIRGDKSSGFQNGFWLVNSGIMQKLVSLGLVAPTSNTWGMGNQDQIVLTGMANTLLGMSFIVTDKLSANASDATDDNVFLLEKGAIQVTGSLNPIIKFSDVEDGFAQKIKFRIGFSAGVRNVRWAGAQQDIYTNAELATSSNWALGALSAKNVPLALYVTDKD